MPRSFSHYYSHASCERRRRDSKTEKNNWVVCPELYYNIIDLGGSEKLDKEIFNFPMSVKIRQKSIKYWNYLSLPSL